MLGWVGLQNLKFQPESPWDYLGFREYWDLVGVEPWGFLGLRVWGQGLTIRKSFLTSNIWASAKAWNCSIGNVCHLENQDGRKKFLHCEICFGDVLLDYCDVCDV